MDTTEHTTKTSAEGQVGRYRAWRLPEDLAKAIGSLPRARVLSQATPLEAMPRLGAEYGVELLVKRDDMTGLGMGGNKVRKLEFYFGKAIANDADTVLITGAVQSNFVRIAAAFAARFGLHCHIQLEERVAKTGELYRSNGNVLLDDLFGAARSSFPIGEDETAADREVERLAEEYRSRGRRPFIVPLSPDKPPLGAVGYVLAAEELLQQQPDLAHVVVASGSGLTHSGLLFGLKAMGFAGTLNGICVRRTADRQLPRILGHCERLAALLGVANPVREFDVIVDDAVLAPGYGQMNDSVAAAIRAAARLEGLVLDPVYTGRVFAGAKHRIGSGKIRPDGPVAIIHTGGLPALFAYEKEIRAVL